MTDLLPDKLTSLAGVGPKRAEVLQAAGFERPIDLLRHLPVRYEDRRSISTTDEVTAETSYTLVGRLMGVHRIFTRQRGLRIVRGKLVDEEGEIAVVWFNQPYLAAQVDETTEYLVHGAARRRAGRLEMVNPSLEKLETSQATTEIVPVYRAIDDVGARLVRRLIRAVLRASDLEDHLEDPIPGTLLTRHGLPALGPALRLLHEPTKEADFQALNLGASLAHQRFAYSELLELRLRVERLRSQRRGANKGHQYLETSPGLQAFEASLPFALTQAQARVRSEILADLRKPLPMQRLLQGDVGCGKTVIALLALVYAIESGLQGAFMVPTELLAEQHYASLRSLLPAKYDLALFSSSSGQDPKRLASGEVQLAIGTHALIQESVTFANLGLVVIDEQQRFGVEQRRELVRKGECPDLLVMTATPIPRTLAMTLYGDLDLSVIDELPPGRQPVQTSVFPVSRRAELYAALARRLAAGGQAYIVMPFVDESTEIEAASLERQGHEVRSLLEGVRCAEVHGRMSHEQREREMASFVRGETQVLIATTVIEVGVDVPAATFMLIESAERFGLTQLHQLRGRVGRGGEESYCVALHGSLSAAAEERLQAFAATDDGFEIAAADLRIRGAGDLAGGRQSGLDVLRFARLERDGEWLEKATEDARELLRERG